MNLLPQKEKKKNEREYFYRFWTGVAGALLFSLLIGCVSLLPSYFLIKVKQTELQGNLATLKSSFGGSGDEVYKVLETIDKKVYFLSIKPSLSLTEAMKKISNSQPVGVKINSLTYHPQVGETGAEAVVALNGVARSREAIVAFVKALQQDSVFSNINVPVSNFAEARDIKFSLTLVQHEK